MTTTMRYLTSVLMAITAVSTLPPSTNAATVKGDKPKDSPGWVVVEEDWFYPLRYDPVLILDSARYHYRRNEEDAAAQDIGRALSWLEYASEHAMPITKEKIDSARTTLEKLKTDLDKGMVYSAARLDMDLAKASTALAEWHYFKARESYGKNDLGYAAQDLQAAVKHLRHAADSAHYEYGMDTITVFDDVFDANASIDHDQLGRELDSIEKATNDLSKALTKAGK